MPRVFVAGGYGAFSVAPEQVPTLIQYIARQEEHHQRDTSREEFIQMCREYLLEPDERFVE